MHADTPTACENCATPLQGAFCHVCGQRGENPLRHVSHALEDVFESFWHLDGRVFRTLRDLLVPGRVPRDYIAGHRTRYVAPLRLFFVLSVLTFFVAQSVVHWDRGVVNLDPAEPTAAGPAFADARTVEDVLRERDAQIAEIRRARASMADVPLAGMALEKSIDVVEKGAEARIRTIRTGKLPPPVPKPAARDTGDIGLFELDPAARSEANPIGLVRSNAKPWHETGNPFVIDGWPRLTRWLNAEIAILVRNVPRVQEDPDLLKNAVLRSIPIALLLLLPVFALLLKLAYLRRGRFYLEHLVVALYSHAFLCIGVLGVCLLTWLQSALAARVVDALLGVGIALLWAWMPAYLLLTQKRVYAQGWLRTSLKFAVLGSIYGLLLTFAVVPLFVVGFLRA